MTVIAQHWRGFSEIQSFALGQAFDNVDEDDIGVVAKRQILRDCPADHSGADHADLRPTSPVPSPRHATHTFHPGAGPTPDPAPIDCCRARKDTRSQKLTSTRANRALRDRRSTIDSVDALPPPIPIIAWCRAGAMACPGGGTGRRASLRG